AQVSGATGAAPTVESEKGLAHAAAVDLHRAVVARNSPIAPVVDRVAGISDAGFVVRVVVARPEFDIATAEVGAGGDASDAGNDPEVGQRLLKECAAGDGGHADLTKVLREWIHRYPEKL